MQENFVNSLYTVSIYRLKDRLRWWWKKDLKRAMRRMQQWSRWSEWSKWSNVLFCACHIFTYLFILFIRISQVKIWPRINGLCLEPRGEWHAYQTLGSAQPAQPTGPWQTHAFRKCAWRTGRCFGQRLWHRKVTKIQRPRSPFEKYSELSLWELHPREALLCCSRNKKVSSSLAFFSSAFSEVCSVIACINVRIINQHKTIKHMKSHLKATTAEPDRIQW